MDTKSVATAAVVLGLSIAVALVGTKAAKRYLQASKERLLLKNRQPSDEQWAAYEAARAAYLNAVLGDPSKADPSARPADKDSMYQFFTPYDLVPGRYEGSIAMSDYLDSLQSESERTGQMVVETLLSFAQKLLGTSIPLPLTWFMPKKVQNVESGAVDVLQMLGILSPLQLAAAADGKFFIDRRKPRTLPEETVRSSRLPARFELSQLDSLFSSLSVPGRDAPEVLPSDLNPSLFPGLKKGWSPARHLLQPTVAEARRNKALAEVCNRLMVNDLLALGISPPKKFPEEALEVLMPSGEVVTRLPRFVEALREEGCSVQMYIRSAAAVFGACFTVERVDSEGEPYLLDVPFTLFARSGVYSEELSHEAILPVLHSGIQLQISGCLRSTGQAFDCAAQYYLSLSGLCGWNARNGIQDRIPWNEGKIVTQWNSPEEISEVLSLSIANAALYSSYADFKHLSSGGYALTGVCADSIATIQTVMDGKCSLYPLMALPLHKLGLAAHANALAVKAQDLSIKEDLQKIAAVLPTLPSDCILDTRTYGETVARIQKSFPWKAGEEPFLSSALASQVLRAEQVRKQA